MARLCGIVVTQESWPSNLRENPREKYKPETKLIASALKQDKNKRDDNKNTYFNWAIQNFIKVSVKIVFH